MTFIRSASICAAFDLLAIAVCLAPQAAKADTLKDKVVGTWSAVSQYVDQNGKKLEPFGPDPKGMVMYDRNGHFMLILQRSTLPKFQSNNRLAGAAQENQAIVQGSIAYFGTYVIDETQNAIKLHFAGSTYPNWDGDNQTRLIEISVLRPPKRSRLGEGG